MALLEPRRIAALRQHRHHQIEIVADHRAHFDRDEARSHSGYIQRAVALPGKVRAMAAGVADKLDQLGLSVRIAVAMAAFGLVGHAEPGLRAKIIDQLAFGISQALRGRRRRWCKRHGRADQSAKSADHNRCAKSDHDVSSSPDFSLLSRLRASDSSTVRNSGSPMSRKLSPNSIGMGLSDGGGLAGLLSGGGLTAP